MLTLFVKRLTPTAMLPVKGSLEAACFDLHVDSVEQDSFGWTVHTGIAVAMPRGYGMFIYARSGLGTKYGLTLRNGTGVIDSDYRGEILLKLYNGFSSLHRNEILQALEPRSRIAQATILQIPDVTICEVADLDTTARGAGGFGSTGT